MALYGLVIRLRWSVLGPIAIVIAFIYMRTEQAVVSVAYWHSVVKECLVLIGYKVIYYKHVLYNCSCKSQRTELHNGSVYIIYNVMIESVVIIQLYTYCSLTHNSYKYAIC